MTRADRSPSGRSRQRAAAAALAVAVLLSLGGCGGSSDSDGVPPAAATGAPSPATTGASSSAATAPEGSGDGTPIRVVIDGEVLAGRLWDNAPARDLIARLPLTMSFTDHSGQEKIGHLDQPLPMDGMPEGDDPVPGDIGWHAPWGNVVLYYGDVGYWDGIARIGRVDGSTDPLETRTGNFTATIELDR